MMGCGKTTIGKILAKEINYKFVDCDDFLEQKYDKKISDCFAISEKYFRDLETACLEELSKEKGQVLSTGGGMVLKKENIDFFKDDIIIFINRPIENILSDVDIENRPLLKDNKEKAIIIYNSRINLYKKYCDFEVINDSSISHIVNMIIKQCNN